MKIERAKSSEISKAIDEYVHNERNRKLMKRRLIDGIKIEKLAEEFQISVSWTRCIIKKIYKSDS